MIARHLTPRGLFLANVIDGKCYDFLRSYAKTLKLSFRNVAILTVPGQPISGERATVVVVSTNGELPRLRNLYPYDSLLSFIERGEDLSLMDALTPFREEKARKPVTLEDDFVPVDQLLAPVFGESLKEVGAATETATPLRCPASGTS
jgi:hypothetical protein